MDRGPQIKRLPTPPAGITVGKLLSHLPEEVVIISETFIHEEGLRVFQRLANTLASRDFAHAGVSCTVFEKDQIAREERTMRSAQVQKHAVTPGYGDNQHFRNARRTREGRGFRHGFLLNESHAEGVIIRDTNSCPFQ